MRPSFEPGQQVGSAHAALPERSRALSIFVALAHRRLPLLARLEGSIGAVAILLGLGVAATLFVQSPLGWLLCLAAISWGLISFWPRRPAVGDISRRQRTKAIQVLEGLRRSVGLDHAVDEGPLAAMEAPALHWERLDNALQASVWESQPDLHGRISAVAALVLEEIIVIELGLYTRDLETLAEQDIRVGRKSVVLERLADQAERVTNLLEAYPRDGGHGTGAPLPADLDEIRELENLLFEARW